MLFHLYLQLVGKVDQIRIERVAHFARSKRRKIYSNQITYPKATLSVHSSYCVINEFYCYLIAHFFLLAPSVLSCFRVSFSSIVTWSLLSLRATSRVSHFLTINSFYIYSSVKKGRNLREESASLLDDWTANNS